MDIVALSALIISILTIIGGIIVKLHMSHCKSGCIESDCMISRQSHRNVEESNDKHIIDDPVDEITITSDV
jgi:hypothetical protein